MCDANKQGGVTSLQDLLHHVDEEKKGNLPIDQLWHEREAFGSVLCSLDVDDETVFAVIQERINQLKNSRSAALDLYAIDLDGKRYTISLADLLICNWACIKASFEDAINNEEMDSQELDNVHELADRITHANELLKAVGVKQQLSEKDIELYFQDIVEAVARQTTEFAECSFEEDEDEQDDLVDIDLDDEQ